MESKIPGLDINELTEQEKPASPVGIRILKWAALALVIVLAAAAVTASVLYTRYVSGENGKWVIDLTGESGVSRQQLDWLEEHIPDAEVLYDVEVGSLQVRNTATTLTLTDAQGVTARELIEAAPELPGITALNLTGLTVSIEQYEQLKQAYPRAAILWTVPVLGGLSPDVTALSVNDMASLRELAAAKSYLPKLTRVDMNGAQLTTEEMAELGANSGSYGFEVMWSITVYGQNYDYDTTSLTLTGAHITDLTELYRLPNLAQVTLDGVGVTDLTPLVAMPSLESITLKNMSVDGIGVLGNMYWLGGFYVKNTNVAQWQLNDLQKQLPECIIMSID